MKESCKETLRRAYLYLDGEVLGDDERAEIRRHLEDCSPCYERYGVVEEVHLIIARLKGCTRCPQQLRIRIQDLLERERPLGPPG